MSERKYENIFIRCDKGTKRRFKIFMAQNDFANFEEALLHLLDYYEGKISKAPIKSYGP